MDPGAFQSAIQIAVSVAVLLSPVPFVLAVLIGGIVANRRGGLGPIGSAVVSFTGGVMFGTFLLVETDLLVRLPILLVDVAIVVSRWRAGRRQQAGWFVVGASLPWTVLYGLLAAVMLAGDIPYDPGQTLGLLAVGLVPLVVGAAVIARGDPAPPEPRKENRAGQPGSRDFGAIAHAIREPSFLGPFGLQEIAMLIAMIIVLLTVPFLIRDLPVLLRALLLPAIVAVAGTEAYIRAMTTRSRRAFEAFSWLGEWELARARRAIGRLPLSHREAIAWLSAHPMGPIANADELPVRIEIELLAGRHDEARALLDHLPTGSPWTRFEKAALSDLVDWRAGGDGAIDAMEEAAREIVPADSDERLRAEVTIAVARVRRRMADGRPSAGDAALPLVQVRDRLGSRADGQVGRALRRRILPVLFTIGFVFTVVAEILTPPG